MGQRGIDCPVRAGLRDPRPASPSEDLVPNPRRSRTPSISSKARVSLAAGALATVTIAIYHPHPATAAAAPTLRIEEVGSDSTAFDVVATIVIGPTEALLFDAQYHVADARRLADRVAATGKHLKAIFLSHPDHDHFAGAATIVERFPGTPVYMTPKALEEYTRTAPTAFRNEKARAPQMLADSIVTPQPLPSNRLTVDGERIEIIPDLTGDVITGVNSIAWIPSIGTVLAGDIVFNTVHAWLGSSDTTSRLAWRQSLARIAALHPKVVVAGHKKDVAAPDTPNVVAVMDRYLADFDSLRRASPNGPALYQAMAAKYPDHAVANLLRFSAMAAFRGATPPGQIDDGVRSVHGRN
jgi:glyoxylase-like metal-dependent hydrolase (beta-lactamase superfamily II)